MYNQFFQDAGMPFISESAHARSNYWLNAMVLNNRQEREQFLAYATNRGIQARPVWKLIPGLSMYRHCQCAPLETAQWLEDRLVNLPSSVRI
jgi:perosamine synthetase